MVSILFTISDRPSVQNHPNLIHGTCVFQNGLVILKTHFLCPKADAHSFLLFGKNIRKKRNLCHINSPFFYKTGRAAMRCPACFVLYIRLSLLDLNRADLVLRNSCVFIQSGVSQPVCVAIREVEGHPALTR